MKAITTILNISVLGFGICKFDLSDRLCQQGDGMVGPQLRSGKVDGYRMQKCMKIPQNFVDKRIRAGIGKEP